MQIPPVQRHRRFHKKNCALVIEIQFFLQGPCLHHFDAVVVILDSDTVSHQRFVKSTTIVLTFDASWNHTSVLISWHQSVVGVIRTLHNRLRSLVAMKRSTTEPSTIYMVQKILMTLKLKTSVTQLNTWDWLVRHQLPIDSKSSFSIRILLFCTHNPRS